jgi:hypothetical protein
VDGTIKKSISDKGKKKVDSVPDQMSVVSSSSEKNKSNEEIIYLLSPLFFLFP